MLGLAGQAGPIAIFGGAGSAVSQLWLELSTLTTLWELPGLEKTQLNSASTGHPAASRLVRPVEIFGRRCVMRSRIPGDPASEEDSGIRLREDEKEGQGVSVGEDGGVHPYPRFPHLSSASDSAMWIQVWNAASRWASGAISSGRRCLLPPPLDPLGAVAWATPESSRSRDTRALASK